MIFASAGHNTLGVKKDPGAVANGYKEADKTVEFRDLVVSKCRKMGFKVITDFDDETLGQYLTRIKTGSGSVVIEFHFDGASTPTATGTTGLIEAEADRLDRMFAKELTDATALILGIKNRGVLTEKSSHRGSLGLMREEGIICLLELCFLTNLNDMKSYEKNKFILAEEIASIIIKYEKLI
jgi:N-acetylmuramoyl-L-alanine amidase